MAAMADTLLTTTPPASLLRHSKWTPARSRVSTRHLRPTTAPLLRVRCCDSNNSRSTSGNSAVAIEGSVVIEEPRDDGSSSSSSSGRCFGEVYVACVPLRAPNGAAQVLDALKDSEIFAGFQHYMVVIKPNDDQAPCAVLDFQPQNPEDPMTAVAVLMGKSIPGVILERTLPRLPSQRCWWVGAMKPDLSLEDAVAFSRAYNSELSLGINDCRHHTLDLVEYLTGKSMTFIEQVRTAKEEESVDEPEPEDEQKNELGFSSFWNLLGAAFQIDNEEKNEVESSSSESLEESPDLESIEPPVKTANSIKEKVLYVPDSSLAELRGVSEE